MYQNISKQQLQQATNILQAGGVVALPTETVYGLAGDASNPVAINKIFSTKNRPADHPLILHIANIEQLSYWAKTIPDYAQQLAQAFWPGPMTLILEKQPHVLDLVTGEQNTVGLRIPNHPIFLKILQQLNAPNTGQTTPIALAAPSANSFGQISPTLAEHIKHDLGDKVDLIIDGGICSVGIESTIIDCTGPSPRILRPGMLSETEINAEIKHNLTQPNNFSDNKIPRVPGALASHYAPKTTTRLVSNEQLNQLVSEAALDNYVVLARTKPATNTVKLYDSRLPSRFVHAVDHSKNWILMPQDPEAYAHCLYEQLHFADQLGLSTIIIEDVPNDQETWRGIRDRLIKASC